MKIDELYFGYTPYSKYTLNEDENKDSSNDNSEQESSAEKKNTKEKVNKNTKVNIDAYFKLTNDESTGQNGPKGFAEELEDLLEKIKEKCSEVTKIKFELNAEEYGDPFGSIDHQSQDLLDDEDLIEIIFNKGCLIVIDNDNSCYYDAFNPSLEPGLNTGIKAYVDSSSTYSKYNITEKDFEE